MEMTVAPELSAATAAPTSDAFREAMRQLASGVSIVTAGRDNEWTGMTATSVSSLSLEPPTVLACVSRESSIVPFLERYWHFAISFLSANQHELADRFAGRSGFEGLERFRSGNWSTLVSGAPVLGNALASLDCKLEDMIQRHSHVIIVGRVLCADVRGRADALLHWRGDYARLAASSLRPS
jgi:flavin reductase (DIM6/NTAB) family NADH-FMN oxidoreductase RutF